MIIVKYLQELPEPIYTTQYEAHFKIAFGMFLILLINSIAYTQFNKRHTRY